MSLITPKDLDTELYAEVINQITRYQEPVENEDPETVPVAEINQEVQDHIDDAEAFIKTFLFKYDLDKLFGTEDSDPAVKDHALKKCVKVTTSWFLIRKANPNVNLSRFEADFMFWIGTEEEPGWIYGIRDGKLNPGWPYPADDPDTPEDESGSDVYWTSTTKRTNRF
ncbi:hypothetical protein AP75_01940 [Kaistella haifensis DSM 19056]|uniref:Uncharacterized protein n=1 Tax=Kaistella haifensis DSM 19056 TaxID=1450526 RepID=A0A246BC72_9FLAO|nr:hypothetical protein [Kaistella haifensis]OWK99272.1 hypothetical protein AP75_01940 [Kaistella haifensis DSM 19056]